MPRHVTEQIGGDTLDSVVTLARPVSRGIGESEYRICLLGTPLNTGNLGVSALGSSLCKLILDLYPNARVTLLVGQRSPRHQLVNLGTRSVMIPVMNHRLSPFAPLQQHLFWILFLACMQAICPSKRLRKRIVVSNPFLKSIAEADWIGDIWGGDSLSDIYGLNRFILLALPRIVVLLLNKPFVLLPQTYGPFGHPIAKLVASLIIGRSSRRFARDFKGGEELTRLLGNNEKIEFCPDVGFVLQPSNRQDVSFDPPLPHKRGEPLIGFNISGLLYNGGYTRDNMFQLKCDYRCFVHTLAEQLLKHTKARILFVPHNFGSSGNVENDYEACQNVYQAIPEQLKDRAHMTVGKYDQCEAKGIISFCDFFIGSRMHSCIAALSQAIPTVGIAYSKKFFGVFQSVGVEEMVIDARRVGTQMAVSEVFKHFKNRERIRESLDGNVERARVQILATMKNLLSEI